MLDSQIITTANIDLAIERIKPNIKAQNIRVIQSDEFKIDNAKEAIKEAYISSEEKKYILLASKKFNIYAQNSLLKILEEPPKNIVFIIITNSKSSLLPTIKSRLKINKIKDSKEKIDFTLELKNITKQELFNFLKTNQRIKKDEAKELIQAILEKIAKEEIKLSESELNIFSNSYKLLELNSRPINILTNIMFNIIKKSNNY